MENLKSKKLQQIKEEERLSNVITNKMTLVFGMIVALIILFVKFDQNSTLELSFLNSAISWVQLVSGILFAAAVVYRVISYKKGIDEKGRVFSSPLLLGTSATLFAIMMLYMNLGSFRAILFALVACLWFFVYQIYKIDFFLFSIVIGASGFLLSLVGTASFGNGYVGTLNIALLAITIITALLASLFMYILNKNKKVTFAKTKILLDKGVNSKIVYIGSLVAILALVCALLFGQILYIIAALCAVYLIVAIIYTVKLM